VLDYSKCGDGESLIQSLLVGGKSPFTAAADNLAWTTLGLPQLSTDMDVSLNSISLLIKDEGSLETLVLDGLLVNAIPAAFRSRWYKIYKKLELEEDIWTGMECRGLIVGVCKDWEAYVETCLRPRCEPPWPTSPRLGHSQPL
jgi:hypothetical protein